MEGAPILFLIPYPINLALAWAMAFFVASVAMAAGRRGHEAAGLGLMTVPLWLTLWGILNTLEPLVSGGTVLRPYSTYQLSGLYSRSILLDLGYLGAGFLLYARGASLRRLLAASPQAIASDLRQAGLPLGRGGEGTSLATGFLLFPLLLLGAVAVDLLTRDVAALHQGDEASVWDNMTVFHALLISLAAAFGEELLYRGFLQGALSRVAPMPVAIALQAVFFAFAHAGYGTWIHVLQPFLFALLTGVVAWRWGLWAAVALHALVDIYAIGIEATGTSPWFAVVLTVLLYANVVATAAAGAYLLLRRLRILGGAKPV